jgi:AraC-like DNA-binding protein
MGNEYEIIDCEQLSGVRLFLVDLRYRNLHMHKEFELCLILEGILNVYTCGNLTIHGKGGILLFNPYQPHELQAKADESTLVLSLQVSPRFFSRYYQTIDSLEFDEYDASSYCNAADCKIIQDDLLALAEVYFSKSIFYELLCVSHISCIFYQMLKTIPSRCITEKEKFQKRSMNERLGRILSYADEHFTEKVLLGDIAALIGVSLSYLSHWFKDRLGLPFQKYIELLRLREARRLLEQTSMHITDISFACGFSDCRYLNRVFVKQIGCTPREYRSQRSTSSMPTNEGQFTGTQRFLSSSESLSIINKMAMNRAPVLHLVKGRICPTEGDL